MGTLSKACNYSDPYEDPPSLSSEPFEVGVEFFTLVGMIGQIEQYPGEGCWRCPLFHLFNEKGPPTPSTPVRSLGMTLLIFMREILAE